jgi:L-seryl-tRNA(Ser) seleniumtransferase
VDRVLRDPDSQAAIESYGRTELTSAVRVALDETRSALRGGGHTDHVAMSVRDILDAAVRQLNVRDRSNLQSLFNLTGTLIHTNLGRAVLAENAARAAYDAAVHATNLEYDLDAGKRGDRDSHLHELICELTGAQAATVVNNNAAAVLLVLNTLALGREVPVSRGELVEIGDAFRIPDIIERSGALLREVGTTNRTHARDYANAIGDNTALLMSVHTSNYVIKGFTAAVAPRDLSNIAHDHGLPLVNDLGSGTLIELADFGLPREPTVREALDAGADIVTFSGDKILGGPQAGIIVGSTELMARIKRNPMRRALRVDKLRVAALEETLRLYRNPERLQRELPTLHSMLESVAQVRARAERIRNVLAPVLPSTMSTDVVPSEAQPGSGALPGESIESFAVAVSCAQASGIIALERALRALPVAVIARIHDDQLLLDMRGLRDETGLAATLEALPKVLTEANT